MKKTFALRIAVVNYKSVDWMQFIAIKKTKKYLYFAPRPKYIGLKVKLGA